MTNDEKGIQCITEILQRVTKQEVYNTKDFQDTSVLGQYSPFDCFIKDGDKMVAAEAKYRHYNSFDYEDIMISEPKIVRLRELYNEGIIRDAILFNTFKDGITFSCHLFSRYEPRVRRGKRTTDFYDDRIIDKVDYLFRPNYAWWKADGKIWRVTYRKYRQMNNLPPLPDIDTILKKFHF